MLCLGGLLVGLAPVISLIEAGALEEDAAAGADELSRRLLPLPLDVTCTQDRIDWTMGQVEAAIQELSPDSDIPKPA